jgi:hypothetical protein
MRNCGITLNSNSQSFQNPNNIITFPITVDFDNYYNFWSSRPQSLYKFQPNKDRRDDATISVKGWFLLQCIVLFRHWTTSLRSHVRYMRAQIECSIASNDRECSHALFSGNKICKYILRFCLKIHEVIVSNIVFVKFSRHVGVFSSHNGCYKTRKCRTKCDLVHGV